MSAVLSFDGVSVTFRTGFGRSIDALSDFTLDIEEGSIFGLLGPNGAGKSTAIYVALSLLRPQKGDCFVFGKRLTPGSELFADIGYLPEEPHYHDFLTVREAITFYSEMSAPGQVLPIDETLERVGMLTSASRPIRQCSKGMKQRMGLAQAIIHKPRLLILDEPTRGLDPMMAHDFRSIMMELNQSGTTILINSHVLSEVELTCSRVAILKSGRIAVMGPLHELLTTSDYYNVRFESATSFDLPDAVRTDGVWSVRVSEENLNAAWEKIRTGGSSAASDARLISVERGRRSLEDLFVETMKLDKPS